MISFVLAATLAHAAPADLDLLGNEPPESGSDDTLLVPDFPGYTANIINGDELTTDDWSSAGGLIVTGKINGFQVRMLVCTGSLIAPDVVLTAAHCIDTDSMLEQQGLPAGTKFTDVSFALAFDEDLTRYGFGQVRDLPDDAGESTDEDPEEGDPKWVYNDNWEGKLQVEEHGDIALVFLDEPLTGHPLAYLPTEEEEEQMAKGDELYLVGYGLSSYTQQKGSGIRRGGPSKIYQFSDYKVQVAGDTDQTRVCSGDSGGPAYWRVETDSTEEWRQIGIASYVTGYPDACTQGWSTLATGYRDWIDEQMRLRCENDERSWCEVEGIVPPPLPDGRDVWEVEDEEGTKKACGCDNAATASWPLAAVGLLGLLLRRSRRR